jgi:hypothetical protein
MDPATLAIAATPFLVKAVEALGEKVWDKASDAAADEAAGFGRRLLAKLLHRGHPASASDDDVIDAEIIDDADASPAQAAVASAVRDVVEAPADTDTQAALRLAVRKLLAADPALLAEVAGFIEQKAPGQRAGDGAVVIGGPQSQGVNVTGSSNTTNVTYGGHGR